jgi:outer membrane protein OmpA-like peptidoglycan-associated protein
MGDAVAAIAGGTHAIEWNPAGVARANLPMAQMGLGFNPTTTDFQFNTAVLYPFPDGTVFALSQFSDFPKSPTSSTTYIGSVALPLNSERDFFLGLNLKYLALSTEIDETVEGGEGLGLDMGLAYDLRGPEGTVASFGLAAKDINTEVRFNDTQEQPVTRTFVLGAAYQGLQDTRIEMDYDIIDQTLEYTGMSNRLRLGAERFFNDRFYSVRAGFDDLFGNDQYFSVGAGYHPSQPYEISYAFRTATNGSESVHLLSFIWQFEEGGKKENTAENIPSAPASSEINIGNLTNLIEPPANTGKPVSGVPLRKMAIQTDPSVFSPAGKQKTTNISFPGDNTPDIARWLVSIQTNDQKTIRRFAGTGPLAPSFAWDGLNELGKEVPEGKYRISLKTFGKKNELLSDDFETVEILAPRSHFEIQTADLYFSTHPTKKGKGGVNFNVNPGGSSEVQSWDFEISEASTNKVVFEKQGQSRLPKTLRWDGTNLDGDKASDGAYLCLLIAQDKAGNPLKTDALQVFLNNTPPELTLKGEDRWADFGSNKSFHFDLNAADRVGITQWKLALKDENGKTFKNFGSTGTPPTDMAWDGTTDQGQTVVPGSFLTAVLSATDRAGNNASSDPVPVQVDYQPPSGQEQMTLNLTTVYFNSMSSDLTESAKKEIEKSADSIKPYLNKSLLIIKGYTSPTETGDILSLSHDRALEVKKYLMRILNISDNNIFAVGYADREPLKTSPSAVTEDPQRRAVITLTTTQ